MVCLLCKNTSRNTTRHHDEKCGSFRRFWDWRRNKTKEQQQANLALDFLCNACPEDVVATVLALAGPQSVKSLQCVDFKWYAVINRETTWRGLCEQLYKWYPGQDPPESWKEYYRLNPCVPIDFSSISSALTNHRNDRKLRIWIRPGRYVIKESCLIRLASNDHRVTIQRMGTTPCNQNKVELCSWLSLTKASPIETCMFRIVQGQLTLRGLSLIHQSETWDGWQQNAAIQVETPTPLEEEQSLSDGHPTVHLEHCRVASFTGRGIVALAGGHVFVNDCHVHSCYYSGIYLASAYCCVQNTDISGNCVRIWDPTGGYLGTSLDDDAGIYFMGGHLNLINSNVSANLSAGMTIGSAAIARDQLCVQQTDILQNVAAPILVFGIAGSRVHPSSSAMSFCRPRHRSSVFEPTTPLYDLEYLRRAMLWLEECAGMYGM